MSEIDSVIFPKKFNQASLPIVMSSRLRLARNLNDYQFPQYSNSAALIKIADICKSVLMGCKTLKEPKIFDITHLSTNEKSALVESHLCSIELAKAGEGSCFLVSNDNSIVIMINEEDHLRMQIFSNDLDFKNIWMTLSDIDDYFSASVKVAYDDTYGFLTACPTNVGTGMRGSVMLHLAGLVYSGQINAVINAVQKLGFVVRGIYGEGSNSLGGIFQISNLHTLGLSEVDILSRLYQIIASVIENENLARNLLIKNRHVWLQDIIGRSFGILHDSFVMNAEEAINHLSNMRLAIDLGYLDDKYRASLDYLMANIQPAHVKLSLQSGASDSDCDAKRSEILREFFSKIPTINF